MGRERGSIDGHSGRRNVTMWYLVDGQQVLQVNLGSERRYTEEETRGRGGQEGSGSTEAGESSARESCLGRGEAAERRCPAAAIPGAAAATATDASSPGTTSSATCTTSSSSSLCSTGTDRVRSSIRGTVQLAQGAQFYASCTRAFSQTPKLTSWLQCRPPNNAQHTAPVVAMQQAHQSIPAQAQPVQPQPAQMQPAQAQPVQPTRPAAPASVGQPQSAAVKLEAGRVGNTPSTTAAPPACLLYTSPSPRD